MPNIFRQQSNLSRVRMPKRLQAVVSANPLGYQVGALARAGARRHERTWPGVDLGVLVGPKIACIVRGARLFPLLTE